MTDASYTIQSVDNPTIHNLGLLLLFETGVRVGELCVLKPENITEEGIHIETTEIYYKDTVTGKNVFEIKETPKMGADDRTLGHSDIMTTRDYYYFCTQNQSYKEKQISSAVNL